MIPCAIRRQELRRPVTRRISSYQSWQCGHRARKLKDHVVRELTACQELVRVLCVTWVGSMVFRRAICNEVPLH